MEKLDKWQDLYLRYGKDVGPEMARVMLLSWIPKDLRTDCNKLRTSLTTVPQCIDYIKDVLSWEHSEMLASERTRASKSRNVFSVRELEPSDARAVKE